MDCVSIWIVLYFFRQDFFCVLKPPYSRLLRCCIIWLLLTHGSNFLEIKTFYLYNPLWTDFI